MMATRPAQHTSEPGLRAAEGASGPADSPRPRPARDESKGSTPPRRAIEALLTGAALAALLGGWAAEAGGADRPAVLGLHIVAYLAGGWFGVRDTVAALRGGRLDINVLMVAAALGAAAIDRWREGGLLLFLFSLSNTLQGYAMDRSRRAISGLVRLRPTEASVLRDRAERRVSVDQLRVGDRILVRPGERVPADGVIRVGRGDLNEATITGESVPIDKGPGDAIFAGTLNGSASLEAEVSRPSGDSTLARIIRLVETAQAQKAGTQRFLEQYEGKYAGAVFVAAGLAAVVPWLIGGQEFASCFYRSMVLLVVASPCALVISIPATILSAIARGARDGILFKGGAVLERLAEVRAVAFDKTGTLSAGELVVTDVVPAAGAPPGFDADDLLATAAAVESHSEHPIARAVALAARQRGLTRPEMSDFRALAGRGVFARADGYLVWIGGERLFAEHGERIPPDLEHRRRALEAAGKTVLMVHRELRRNGGVGQHEATGGWLGLVAVADRPRPEAEEALRRLRSIGVARTIMLTGDNPAVAAAVARQTGVDEFHAGLLPQEKVLALRTLRERYGPVMMVGDGVNDAPALATADVGAAMGAAGSDVALETADVVLMANDLRRIADALALARRARQVVWQNLHFALAVIGVLVIGTFGWSLPLPLGVVAHEGSTLLVVLNGLRLLRPRHG